MSTAAPLAEGRDLDARTMIEAFHATVDERGDAVAVRTKDDEVSWTWAEVRERTDRLARGLDAIGVGRGDAIALLLSNRPDFMPCDLAAMSLGAVPFSLYQSLAPEQIAYILGDAGARTIVVEPAFLEQVRAARAMDGVELERVIVLDGGAGTDETPFEDVEAAGERDGGVDLEARAREIGPDDLLTLIYTSGTTGPPKGVELIHSNLTTAVRSIEALVRFPHGGRVISWLPAAHIAERAAHHYLPLAYGLEVTCCPDPRQVIAYLPAVRPSWFFAVPRIWEKLKTGLETMLGGLPEEQAAPVQQALAAAIQRVRLQQAGEPVPDELEAAVARADEQVFAGLRKQLGFDAVEIVNCGAAPTPAAVIEFFHAIGVPLAELWGMSETCGAGCCNPPDRIKIGTVGPPAPGVEVKLAEDGELLMRSGVVMRGYRNLPDRTAESLDAEGWLHTGDIAEIDEDGYVTLVDRKKELIINAAGKNMSPASIEAEVKTSHPLIGQACVIGDARRYVTALIVLDPDAAPPWAQARGIPEGTDLASHPDVRAAVQEGVDAANARLSRVEQVKTFTILGEDWQPGGEELTPTMKLKRKPIAAKYEHEIEAMYAG